MPRMTAAIGAVLLAVTSLAGCTAMERPEREAVEHYENGERAYKANNNSVAESEYAAAVALEPGYAQAQLQLGFTRYRLNKFEDAKRSFEHAVKLYGAARLAQEAQFWSGMCDYARGYDIEGKSGTKAAMDNFKAAEVAFSKAIRAGYTENEVFAMRAWMRLTFGELGKAQSDFRRAIKFSTDAAKKKEYQEAVDNINNAYGEEARKAAEKERAEAVSQATKECTEIKDAAASFAKAKEHFEREQFASCRVYCARTLELDAKHEEAAKLLKLAEDYDWAK